MTESESGNEVMERAIFRLGVLEFLFLGLAAVGALMAGALVAWLLGQGLGLPFRPTWAASALLLFLIPGVISYWRVRREEAAADRRRRSRGAHDEKRDEPES